MPTEPKAKKTPTTKATGKSSPKPKTKAKTAPKSTPKPKTKAKTAPKSTPKPKAKVKPVAKKATMGKNNKSKISPTTIPKMSDAPAGHGIAQIHQAVNENTIPKINLAPAKKPHTVSFWLKGARAISLPQSILPALVAVFIAWPGLVDPENVILSPRILPFTLVSLGLSNQFIIVTTGLIAIIGVGLAHLSMNLFDDYFDWKTVHGGNRTNIIKEGIQTRPSKCTYLQNGSATPQQLKTAASTFLAIALLCGAIIFVLRGWLVLIPLLFLIVLGISYSCAPLKLSYRGFGEVVIGLLFGPALMMGVDVAVVGAFTTSTFIVSIATGLLVTSTVYVHSMLDIAADKAAGKTTLAAVLKTNSARMAALIVMQTLPYLLVALGIFLDILSPFYVISFLAIPMSIALVGSMQDFYKNGAGQSVIRKKWYGPMGPWQQIKDAGMEWFMLRWLQARNTMGVFCIAIMLGTIPFYVLMYIFSVVTAI